MAVKLILGLVIVLLPVLVLGALAAMGTRSRLVVIVAGLVVGYRGSMAGYDIALAAVLVEIAAFTIRTVRERREARLGAVVGGEKPSGFWPRRR